MSIRRRPCAAHAVVWRSVRSRLASRARRGRRVPSRLTLRLAVLLVIDVVAGRATERRRSLAAVVLEDVDGRRWPAAEIDAQPLLIVVADRGASEDARAWGREIGRQRGGSVAHWAQPGRVVVVSAADLRAVPSFARGTARWIIAQGRSGRDDGAPPLMLDWDGALAGPVAAKEGTATVLLYAADGRLLLRDEGAPTAEKIARVVAAIDALLAAGGASDAPSAGTAAGAAADVPGSAAPRSTAPAAIVEEPAAP